MGFADAVKSVFSKYGTFSGRASRSEYWYWILFCFLLGIVAGVIDVGMLGVNPHDPHAFYPVKTIVSLAVFLPGLAVSVRRLHDLDRSGWWMLIMLIPIIGIIILLVMFCMGGTVGDNRFGPDPLAG